MEEIPAPVPLPNQALIQVHAAGVNFPDLLLIRGQYQFKPPLPFSPGLEIAGVVQQVGSGVLRLRPGDAVVGALAAGGDSGWGGFAEAVAVDEDKLVALPAGVPMAVGACTPTTYGTTYHALHDRAQLRPGEVLLVLGAAGGVGLAAVELGKALGARVIAAASSAEKLAVCQAAGADDLIDYSSQDLRARVRELTGGAGADVIYDPVGGRYAEPALRAIAWGGRYLVVGFAAGAIPSIPLNLVLLKGCQIIGVFWGAHAAREPAKNREQLALLLRWVNEGRIRPLVSKTYTLAKAAEALSAIAERRVTGKVCVLPQT